ncbi:MAG: FliM/FliN family flagellar motor switch protein [Woeseiaceae bacterium]|nr:FliM/FliN family flagellar motor switch protein [Woeseiaceae bacterium]
MTDDIENANDENVNEDGVTEGSETPDEPVLSDEEKGALLEGIENGELEVHSSKGPVYAEVKDFVISPRSHIVSNSLPRLDLLNGQLAIILSKTAEKLLGMKVKVQAGNIEMMDFGTLVEREPKALLINRFTAAPLEGPALISFEGGVVTQLTECFYGGKVAKATPRGNNPFTAGEKRVVNKFSESILESIGESWAALSPIKPEATGLFLSTDLIDGIDASTDIISSTFHMIIDEEDWAFSVLWPELTIHPLLPALKDQKRDADAAKDANWRSAISSGVTDSVIRISSQIGQTSMLLRDVAELSAGDIIDIENPRRTFVFAKDVPVLEGLFGVHNGQYAIETTRWLAPSADKPSQ